jgi:delta 1-pyrroline-5-carboxylate dehydrogenase
MTQNKSSRLNVAQKAFSQWSQFELKQRTALLAQWATSLENVSLDTFTLTGSTTDASMLKRAIGIIFHHINEAKENWGQSLLMPSPTGEENRLDVIGRGVFLVAQDDSASLASLTGQLSAALVMGNSVVLAASKQNQQKINALILPLKANGFPDGLISVIDLNHAHSYFSDPALAGVALTGSNDLVIDWNSQLSLQDNAIINLVAESDPVNLPVVGGTDYLISFFTERTSSVNTTAVGGNATLLEQGSKSH